MKHTVRNSVICAIFLFFCIFALIGGIRDIRTDTTAEDMQRLNVSLAEVVDEDRTFHHENIPNSLVPKWNINQEEGNSCSFSRGNAKVTYVFSADDGKVVEIFETTRSQTKFELWAPIVFGAVGTLYFSFALIVEISKGKGKE